ncbi:cytochrome P450 [Exidia glandulosa HHB12029]|uniref:Cytochrome P450 n=1 Tax=Exidia glandulosa HHB12029 TaxID=1314781 RepID=A0A165GL83_EXIGL|nr:cytochrome P450 [Exidia glandulosa HHB12029]
MYMEMVLAGLMAHTFSFQVNPRSVSTITAVLILGPTAITIVESPGHPLRFFFAALATYLSTLAASIVAYRLSPFHPLASYPGPLLARVSALWQLWTELDGKQHITYRRLHSQYGEIVRTGPNHLHFCSASAIRPALGSLNQWHRHEGYGVVVPPGGTGSIMTVLDPATHKLRRRAWDRAFTASALNDYRPMLGARLRQLRDIMDLRCGDTLDISQWFKFFTFDFMGDFAFGSAFECMARAADPEHFQRTISRALRLLELCSKIPWVRAFVLLVPSPIETLLRMSMDLARSRKGMAGSPQKDLFHYLTSGDGGDLSVDILSQDTLIAVIAGSDTTAAVLANALYNLLTTPLAFAQLRAELDAINLPDDLEDCDVLKNCKYLNAVINETMRLAPVIPNGPTRMPPPGQPVVIDGRVITPDTIVFIPFYALFRDERYFSPDPDRFWPERWLASDESVILDHNAFIPFSYGPTACVGRHLALYEARAVLAMLVQRYDVEFAPGYDPKQWLADLKDHFIIETGTLPVVMKRRVVD